MTDDPTRNICGARTRNTGKPCRGLAQANGRCRMHGGGSLHGLAHPSLRTGRYSKYLPTRMLSSYEAAERDPELLSQREDIALLDTRLGQVIGGLETGESASAWSTLAALAGRLSQEVAEAVRTGEVPESLEETADLIQQTIAQAQGEARTWREIRDLLAERGALVAGERKRLVELQQYVTQERALLFVQAVMGAVKTHVRDTGVLAAISAELSRLSDVQPGGGAALAASG